MADERARARRAIMNTLHSYGTDLADVAHETIADSAMIAIGDFDLSIIDTRTHVAVPREDDEAMVEAVAMAMARADGVQVKDELSRAVYVLGARAALAAMRAHAAKEG